MSFDDTYIHEQTTPSDTWVVQHNLNKPVVSDAFFEVNGLLAKVIPAAVEYTDDNTLTVKFSSNQVGKVKVA